MSERKSRKTNRENVGNAVWLAVVADAENLVQELVESAVVIGLHGVESVQNVVNHLKDKFDTK